MEKQESRSVGMVLWRRKWIILAVAVLALGASLVISLLRTPQYQARSQLMRSQAPIDVTLFGTSIYSSGDVQRDLFSTAASITSVRVALLVKDATGSQRSAGDLLSMVSASASTDSNIITVTVTGPDPQEVATLADAFAGQMILVRKQSDAATLVSARQALEARVALMTPADLESSLGQELQSRIEQLKILEQVQTGGYTVWQQAEAPGSAVSPRPVRDAAAGFAVGVILGLILAVVIDRMDRRLRDYSDFEREFELPILAVIPRSGSSWKRGDDNGRTLVGFGEADSAIAESYRLLRSNLQYFEAEKGLRTILVTSALPQEAKTSTAVNLAVSLAMSGAKVVLIDCDLRNPTMHRYLRVDNRVGLSTVLAGAAKVGDAIQAVRTSSLLPAPQRASGRGGTADSALQKDFLCLTSGPIPPNPAELLASPRMAEVLKGLVALAEYVVVDSAPVLLVADSVSVAPRVDGVIIVSRATSATIDQAHEVRQSLTKVGARLVGLVITDAKISNTHGYRQGYYHQDT